MVSLARYAASAPAGVVPLLCVQLSHSAWAAPERRVMQPDDWTVTMDGVPTLFRGTGASEAGGWLSPNPQSDNNAMAARQLALDDAGEVLYGQIESVRASAEKVICRLLMFLSDDLTAALYDHALKLQQAAPQGGQLTLAIGSRDSGNFRFPRWLYSIVNTPGLRGRK